jgi:hypothetical protein
LDLQKFETQIVSEKNFVRRANRATGLSADFEDKEAEKMACQKNIVSNCCPRKQSPETMCCKAAGNEVVETVEKEVLAV